MQIPPKFEISSEIIKLYSKIEANRELISSYKLSDIVRDRIEKTNVLKSSLFSARIEGNTLTMQNVNSEYGSKRKIEVFNISRSIQAVKRITKENSLSKSQLLNLHQSIMEGITPEAGTIRNEVSAIFNQAGVAVYMTPPPADINLLLNKMIDYINENTGEIPLIKALICHLVFEKIHPFIDGNGRVGRLLIFLVCRLKNYDFGLCVPIENYLDEHRDDYYYHLDNGIKNTSLYLEFMLNAYLEETEKIKSQIMEIPNDNLLLLPLRQEEIYRIIEEHKIVSFDFLKRRFLAVPIRTLHYDLQKLLEKGLIVKVGVTNRCVYRIKT